MKKQLTITIGIPTCYGGHPLVRSIKTMHAAIQHYPARIRVVADSVPLTKQEKKELKKMNVILTENKTQGSQFTKLTQLISQSNSDIFIFTQDDIIFTKDTVKEIIAIFTKYPDATMVTTHVTSVPARTQFERVVESGVRISYEIGKLWNNSDNYLLANGRCMAFKTKALKKINIPNKVVNGDAYLYFANKFAGGKMYLAEKAIVFNKNPETLPDQVKQTKRFENSNSELSSLFSNDMLTYYKIPKLIALHATFNELIRRPLYTLSYLALHVYLFLLPTNKSTVSQTSWAVAKSTKV